MRVTKFTVPPVLAILVAVTAGCGSSSKTATISASAATGAVPATFVGKVSGTDAYIGLVANPSAKIAVYVCDGAGNKIGDFFRGRVSADASDATLRTTDSSNTLTINADQSALRSLIAKGGALTGTWNEAGGARHAFTAQAARPPGALWGEDETVNGTSRHGMWVVLNDGSVRGSIDLEYATQKSAAEDKATQGQSTEAGQSDVKMAVIGGDPPPSLAYQTSDAVVTELAKQTTEKSDVVIKATKDPQGVFYIKRVSPVIPEG